MRFIVYVPIWNVKIKNGATICKDRNAVWYRKRKIWTARLRLSKRKKKILQ